MTTAAAQPAKADRVYNRAPKGGAVSAINGLWYAGGQFLPKQFDGNPIPTTPAPLVGSSRQIPWAARLRQVELNQIEVTIAAMRSALEIAKRAKAVELRRQIRELSIESFRLTHERSAAAIIERKLAKVA